MRTGADHPPGPQTDRGRMTIGHDERHALLEELDLLRDRRREIEETLEVDDRPHDVGDQSEATQRRDDLDWIDLRIRDLTHYLYAAAARDNLPPERVGVGAVVTIRYPDGHVETVQVAALPDEDIPVVTPNSPLGRALVGAAAGEEIRWEAPEGHLRARVEAIRTATAGPVP
jgi:transcription elongation GreA/GreB family factor